MTHTITLIPGDGIGPEVTEAVLRDPRRHRRLDRMGAHEAGVARVRAHGTGAAGRAHRLDPPEQGRAEGAGDDADREGSRASTSRCARRWTCTRTCARCGTCPASTSRFDGVDLVIVRENTEDLYAGLEHEVVPGVVESLKIITERASTRIARVRLRLRAAARPQEGHRDPQGEHHEAHRRAVPRLRARRVAGDYPDIEYDELIVDAALHAAGAEPGRSSTCCCCENLYGDIVSDLCAGLVGGLGVVGARTSGRDRGVRGRPRHRARHRRQEPREPDGAAAVRGDDAAAHRRGRRRRSHHARRRRVLAEGRVRTRDLGGTASTLDMDDAIVERLKT